MSGAWKGTIPTRWAAEVGRMTQRIFAGTVAEGVVHMFESVEIEINKGHRSPALCVELERVAKLIHDHLSIRKTGQ